MLSFAAIASGSNGNCYYVGNNNEAILVDVGISCRETERRMARLGLSMDRVKGVLLTHEHSDHIVGLDVLARKYQLSVYSTEGTWRALHRIPQTVNTRFIKRNEQFDLGNLRIRSFSKSHDAAEAVSYIISQQNYHVGVITDIGYACTEVKKWVPKCHALFLESNYCSHLLESGSYPRALKNRISGRRGHLSNDEALELIRAKAGPQLRHLILSHLSANNNRPELVDSMFDSFRSRMTVYVASRYQESPLWELDPSGGPRSSERSKPGNSQLSLFS